MRKSLIFLSLFLLFASMGFASAKITISEPLEVYNLGDVIYIDVDVSPASLKGFFEINLICRNGSTNLYRVPAEASFSLGESQKIFTNAPLTESYIGGLDGECQISAALGNEEISTGIFTISDEIMVDAYVDQLNYNPGEPITLVVEATKANGRLLNGFVEGSNASDFSKEISDGYMTEIFALPETAESGSYILDLLVYDSLEGILNKGSASVSFDINQIATSIIPILSGAVVVPGENFTIGAEILDQAGILMDGVVSVLIISPEEGEEIQSTIQQGEFVKMDFPLNATPGIWKTYTSFDDVTEMREIEVGELQKVEYEFVDSILVVRNVGNVPYTDTIDINIGDEIQTIDLTKGIGLGEERRFSLKAPDGEYDISVGDGKEEVVTRVALTGKAISVEDLRDVGIFKGYSIIWVFLIVILGGVAVVLFFRFRKRTVKLKDGMRALPGKIKGKIPGKISKGIANTLPFTNKSPDSQSLEHGGKHDDHGMVDLTASKVGTAEASLVVKGEKSPSAILALKVANYNALGENARKELAKIVSDAKKSKGLVDWRGEHIFIVFSSIITKTFNNEILATKTGFDMLEKFKTYNHKFSEKISYNIGINSGDLVSSKEGGKLKYTSLGNTISLAKRISDSGEEKLLVSEDVRKKLLRDLKTKKVAEIGAKNIFEVSQIKDRAANAEKLKDILKRMKTQG
jgi:hypothetical protein